MKWDKELLIFIAFLVVKENVLFEIAPLLCLEYRLYMQSISYISALPLMKKEEGNSTFKEL